MAKVIIFSRFFPGTHPRKGEKTLFPEKFFNSFNHYSKECKGTFFSLLPEELHENNPDKLYSLINEFKESLDLTFDEKFHTIRGGNRFKKGDFFSPRVWSGKPYNSEMIRLAPDIEILETYEFEVYGNVFFLNKKCLTHPEILTIAKNDGLSYHDFLKWFNPGNKNKPFKGQIICWSDKIKY